jgi:outer membrane protein TolC
VNYRAGLANYLAVLIAEVQENQTMIGYIGVQMQRLQDTVALFVARGRGGCDAKNEILRD